MSTAQRYRITDHDAAAAYMIVVLTEIANGRGPVVCGETPAEYAQRHLDALTEEGDIVLRAEDKS